MTAYPPVGSKFGRYQITGVLGQGGMGVVFSAVHENLGRRVALKVLSADLASRPDFRRRFEREASALARLYSPHIIDVYDFGEVDEWLFIATQLVAGRDFRDWLAHKGPLPPREALALIAQVAAALADAHDAGVIHRDIKPSNILLHESTDELYAYVCDFGISQTDDQEHTRTGGVLGTYGYMAPERHQGAEATVASDIYSLGCLLHAALTGRPPYEGTDVQVAMQHIHGDIPTYVGPEPAGTAINRILRRSLAKTPGERYPTASALRADLLAAQKIVADESGPVTAFDDGEHVSDAGRSSRRPVIAVGGAVIAAAVVGAAVLIGSGLLSPDPSCPQGTTASRSGDCQGPSTASNTQPSDTEVSNATSALTCWNGEHVERPQDCSQPVGREGLRWVFPSLDRDFESCYRAFDGFRKSKRDASLRTWFCPSPGSHVDGIGYTEWSSVQGGKAHFNRVFGHAPSEFKVGGIVAGYRWTPTEPSELGYYKEARLYKDLPFSSTVWTTNPKSIERICLEMTARSMDTLKAEPVNCRPEK